MTIADGFWSHRIETWRRVTIADAFTKFEKGGALRNFERVRDGLQGEHGGPPWCDGLLYETICAASDFLAAHPDPAIEQRLDAYISTIAAAAAADPHGYINTYTQLIEPSHRWGLNGGNDVQQHDLYNAGALVEAAVHHYRTTGKTRLLVTAVRLADHMVDVIGPPPRKNVVPGHALAESAFVALYQLFHDDPGLAARIGLHVDEGRYLKLAEFWLENRGNHVGRTDFGSYDQDHISALEQTTIEGHAVRATLMATGLTSCAIANGRPAYAAAASALWDNMVRRRMHLTGGVGAVAGYEGFGPDFALPNDAYLETCAAVGAGFFHHTMNRAFADAKYADELERVLYNGALSGVGQNGNTYFYENPLVAEPTRRRWDWHPCPCCPPMFLKLMGALPGYVYATDSDGTYVNLFVGNTASVDLPTGHVTLSQKTSYPWDGAVALTVSPDRPGDFAVNLRIPAWSEGATLALNGQTITRPEIRRGYAHIKRTWNRGDTVVLTLPMPVQQIKANPRVEADRGRAALMRGPLVYCLESIDNGGHARLQRTAVPLGTMFTTERREDLLGGVTVLRGRGIMPNAGEPHDRSLYQPAPATLSGTPVDILAIPYFANANREPAAMTVWLPQSLESLPPLPAALAGRAEATSSHCNVTDTLAALNDGREPKESADMSIPRFTWWDHRGTKEWVEYHFEQAERVSATEVYWWDETRIKAHCRVPRSWRLFYRDKDHWVLVADPAVFGTRPDAFNRVTFKPVTTTGLRIEVELQPGWSGGLLEWKLDP